MTYKLPPLPEPTALGMDFDKGWDGIRAYGYTEDDMQAYAIAAIEAQGVLDALREEAMNLASILSGMVEGGYSDLETLYTEDQADGDAFVKRAAEVLDLLASAPPAPQALTTCNCRWDGETQVQQCTLHEAHVDAIHEWAERAKTAEEKLLAPQAKPQP